MSRSRVALVTGGAYGIGRGIVEAFARHGERAVIADRDRVRGEALEASLRAEGHDVLFVQTDVREEEQIRAAVARAAEVFGRIDVLVNNAGIERYLRPEEVHRRRLERHHRHEPSRGIPVRQVHVSLPARVPGGDRQHIVGAGVRQ